MGYGGLAHKVLELTGPDGILVGIDRDGEALATTRKRLRPFGQRAQLIQGNFSELKKHLGSVGLTQVDGVVFDLGVSSAQLDRPERGFSFQVDGPLDMRMDQSCALTAEELVSQLSERELADVIYRYGEERHARRIARAVVRARERSRIRSTLDLVSIIGRVVPPSYRHGRIHFATRTFQALRIAVNRELDALDAGLRDGADVLNPGGRLCVISFHSLEDRIAKHTLRVMAQGSAAMLRVLTKKPGLPSQAECQHNPRARSAKLRVAERLPGGQ